MRIAFRFLSNCSPVLMAGVLLLAGCQDHREQPGPAVAAAPTSLPQARSARFVKLEELSEWGGKPWAAMAELNLLDSTGAVVDRSHWTVTADSAGANDSPQNAIDGDPKTHWHSRWEGPDPASPPPHWFIVGMTTPVKVSGFRYLPRQDGTANGAIARYRFYISDDGTNWGEPVSSGDFAGMGTATSEKVVLFASQTVNHPPVPTALPAQQTSMGQTVALQLHATDSDLDAIAYTATGLPAGLAINKTTGLITGTPIQPGDYEVRVAVSDGKAPEVPVTFQWTVRALAVNAAATMASGEVRFTRLEAVSEIDGKPWATVAEFNLVGTDGKTLPRDGWTASADSADTSDRPSAAIDGNPATIWHSQWDGAAPPPPHSLIIDIGHGAKVGGFRYLPRQDKLPNGTISRFRFYTSVDGVDWGKPVAEGDFTTLGAASSEKTVLLK